jgi:hypothetical protein
MQSEREYDLFERLPDGAPVWRGHAFGLDEAEAKLHSLASVTANECFALYLPKMAVVLRLNASSSADPEANAAVR